MSICSFLDWFCLRWLLLTVCLYVIFSYKFCNFDSSWYYLSWMFLILFFLILVFGYFFFFLYFPIVLVAILVSIFPILYAIVGSYLDILIITSWYFRSSLVQSSDLFKSFSLFNLNLIWLKLCGLLVRLSFTLQRTKSCSLFISAQR